MSNMATDPNGGRMPTGMPDVAAQTAPTSPSGGDTLPIEWIDDAGWHLHHPPPYADLTPTKLDRTDQDWTMNWAQAGWDTAAADPRHHALVMRDLFPGDRRPSAEELDWFRLGFAHHRAGYRRPAIVG